MNYTTNYRLPQWERTDPILMQDFNQLCAAIETGLNGVKDAASALSAQLEQKIAAAQAKADAAYSPDQMPYKVGKYAGYSDANYPIIVGLGFRPSFVIISGLFVPASSSNLYASDVIAISGGTVGTDLITFTSIGFDVHYFPDRPPYICRLNHTYDYIAFR